jgi:hypothetical protein
LFTANLLSLDGTDLNYEPRVATHLQSNSALGVDWIRVRKRSQKHPWLTNSAPIYRAGNPQGPADPSLAFFNAGERHVQVRATTRKYVLRINRKRCGIVLPDQPDQLGFDCRLPAANTGSLGFVAQFFIYL